MRAFRFAIAVVVTLLLVGLRRLFKGPLHVGWTYRYEALIEILRRAGEKGHGAPVEAIRRAIPPARIHASVRSRVRHDRAELAGRPSETFTPEGWRDEDPTVLYLHGGGYIVCSPATHRDLVSRIAVATGARCVMLDYRKAPEHPFPHGIDDCEAAYRSLVEQGIPASRLLVAGDSAGGGLTLATLLRVRDAGLPLPRGAVLISPWIDLEHRGESIQKNAPYDYLRPEGLVWGSSLYLAGKDPCHPHATFLYADLAGLPPMLVQSGSAELFLSENERFVERARAAGVDVTHEVEPGMVHVYQAFASFVPECGHAIERIGTFVRRAVSSPELLRS